MNPKLRSILFGGPGTATMLGDVGLVILRLIGLMMAIGHGMGKVFGEGGFGPPEKFVAGVAKMGFPAPTLFAWCAAFAEFVGGILIAVGLLTRPMALILTFNMFVAILGAHLHDPMFSKGDGGAKEPAVLYLLPFAALIFIGAGRFSVDRALIKPAS